MLSLVCWSLDRLGFTRRCSDQARLVVLLCLGVVEEEEEEGEAEAGEEEEEDVRWCWYGADAELLS